MLTVMGVSVNFFLWDSNMNHKTLGIELEMVIVDLLRTIGVVVNSEKVMCTAKCFIDY